MEIFIKILFIILIIYNVKCNYILIPFDTFIYNPRYNNTYLQNDILSMKYSEDLYINLSLGNPIQTIKLLLRLDQYEIIIKEPSYISSLSNSFKLNKFIENKYICNDTFHFITINSSKELNDYIHKDKINNKNMEQNYYKDFNDIKFVYLNKTTSYKFLEKDLDDKEIEKIISNDYGMLGLRLSYINIDSSPDLIKTLKGNKAINSSIFTFVFNDNKKDEHYGYVIIGSKFTDTEKEYEETNNTYFAMRYSRLSWDLKTNTIYSQTKSNSNSNSKNNDLYLEKNIDVQLIIEKGYILGTYNYKKYIEDIFFNELVKEKVCQYKNLLIEYSIGTYVCNSKSKLFLDYYNNIFPDLIFKTDNIEDELILTKNDLFFYNEYNRSDTNIYFIIYFSTIYTTKWMLGRTFFKKYRLSFNSDTSYIVYHKKKIEEEKIENNVNNENIKNNNNIIIKIIFIIFLILIIFLLGFLFHKSITKIPRKQKANELEDEFDYSIANDKNRKISNNLDINTNTFSNKNSFYLELGSKNI